MDLSLAERLLYLTPTPLFVLVVVILFSAGFFFGSMARKVLYRQREALVKEAGHGFLITSSVGVLALILGFTFSIAIGYFAARRQFVVDEGNAVLTTYALSQAVEGGDPSAMRRLLLSYTVVRSAVGRTDNIREARVLVSRSEALEDQIVASAVLVARGTPTSVSYGYLQSAREVGRVAASRLAAKRLHVPTRVYGAILINLAIVAAGIGFEFTGATRYVVAAVLLLSLTASLVLIVDLDRPLNSGITESQNALEDAYRRLAADGLSTAVAAQKLAGTGAPGALTQ